MTSRYTASMLNALGHPEWIAENNDDYVNKVVALANDVPQRLALRQTQRKCMQDSPLCDAKNLAQSLETAYFAMYKQCNLEK